MGVGEGEGGGNVGVGVDGEGVMCGGGKVMGVGSWG